MIRPLKFIGFLLMVLALCLLYRCKHFPYGNNPEAGRYFNIRGIKMYCEVYGSGEPLLLIHGNGGSISTFNGLIPYFSKKYKVIIADSRAQGRSRDDKDSLSFEMMADDYAALLNQLHVDSANVMGWSDGGIIALLLAMRHPAKTHKVIASGPNLWPDSLVLVPDVWKEEKEKYRQLKSKPKTTAKEVEEWKCLQLDMNNPHIPLTALHTIKCPVLVMGGSNDEIRQEHLKAIYENIPRANLWIINPCGHGTIFEHQYKCMYEFYRFFSNDYSKTNDF